MSTRSFAITCVLTIGRILVAQSLAVPAFGANLTSLIVPNYGWGSGCSGYSSQSLPPATINVLMTADNPEEVATVPFEQYVMDVLPHEWKTVWNAQADEAGAIAVKMYGWFYVTHSGHGGVYNGVCYDVTDNQFSQVYVPGYHNSTTDAYVQKTWSIVAWQSYDILDAEYNSGTSYTCPQTPGNELYQEGSQECSVLNSSWNYQNILMAFYPNLTFSGEITGGSAGEMWVIGNQALLSGTDNGIYVYENGWVQGPGSAVRVAVDPNGNPWVVNSLGDIYSWSPSGWVQQQGLATDIAIGPGGGIWILGWADYSTPAQGPTVFSWNGSGWTAEPGQAVRIAVDANGDPWVVTGYGTVYKWNGTGFVQQGSVQGTEIGTGTFGEGLIDATRSCLGGDGIWTWQSSAWSQVPGCAVGIAGVGSLPWVVNSLATLYAYSGGTWVQGPNIP